MADLRRIVPRTHHGEGSSGLCREVLGLSCAAMRVTRTTTTTKHTVVVVNQIQGSKSALSMIRMYMNHDCVIIRMTSPTVIITFTAIMALSCIRMVRTDPNAANPMMVAAPRNTASLLTILDAGSTVCSVPVTGNTTKGISPHNTTTNTTQPPRFIQPPISSNRSSASCVRYRYS